MCGAQDYLARGVEFSADVIGRKAISAIKIPEEAGGQDTAVLARPAPPGSRAYAVPAETITHGTRWDSQHRCYLRDGEMPVNIQLGEDPGQIRRVAAAALRPGPARATGPQRNAGPPQQAGDTLPVQAGDLCDVVG